MGTTRLLLYNEALRHLGERKLSALTETGKSRRVLDGIWDGGWIDRVLEGADWQFATRAIEFASDPDVEPAFGLTYAFSKPTDFVRTAAVASDEYFHCPLNEYTDEGAYWYADIDPLWIKYVSNDAAFGADLSRWPPSFVEYAALWGAHKACKAITQSDSAREELQKDAKKALLVARGRDGQLEPTKFLPASSWTQARHGWGNRGMRMTATGGRPR